MNLLYWNIRNNKIENFIADIIIENKIDVFIVSEFNKLDFGEILNLLNNDYQLQESFLCEKVKIIHKKDIQLTLLRAQHRYIISKLNINNEEILLTSLHLPSNPNNTSDDRKHEIRKIVADIVEEEKNIYKQKMQKTIVIGDMNASPFDSELVNKDSFNAVLFKKIIDKRSSTTYQKEPYERFYNPMLDCINEEKESYGTFYYNSGIGPLYWYCYDQVLVRKALMNKLKTVQFIKTIKNTKLIKEMMPNKDISDHLPLLVKIDF